MLPNRQQQVLDFILAYTEKYGYGPSIEEVREYLGVKAISTAHQHVDALRKKGYLKNLAYRPRSIGTYETSREVVEIPLLGFVSAGEGIEPLENPEPLKVHASLLGGPGRHFALQVRGESMINDGIIDGDIAIIKEQNTAENGDVVVALVEEKEGVVAKIKRFYNFGEKIELRPKNPSLTSEFYPLGKIEIRGKLCGLLRKGG